MATESKSRLDKAREVATGLNRVDYANPSGSQKAVAELAAFQKPVFLQDPEYKDVKGAIMIYNSSGKQLMEPFYNLVISGSRYALSERVSRTATMDGEYRKFLGKGPIRVAFSVAFYDYKNHPWKDQFVYLWNEVFRGSVLKELNASVYIYCGGDIFVGDLHACEIAKASDFDGVVMASLQMDCNRSPIPFNPVFTGTELVEQAAVDAAIQKAITSGVNINKTSWEWD